MKQGNIYTKIILGLFLAVVVCYFGYYLYSANYEGLRTETAIEYEAGAGCYTTGYVVRDESAILSHYEITSLVISEGDRVAAGQRLATGYQTTDAQSRQVRIAELEHELEQLDYARAYSSDAEDQALLEGQIEGHLQAMNRSIARGDMNAALDRSAAIKGLVLRQSSSEEEMATLSQRIDALNSELTALTQQASADTRAVVATDSGYFSGSVDGFEDLLTPAALDTMTVSKLETLQPDGVSDTAIGKLIRGNTWYYVTAVDAALVQDLRLGDSVPVSFVSAFYDDLQMRVERLGDEENGKRLLVLSCDRYMQNVTLLREQSADMVFTSYIGLRVPKEAIRVRVSEDDTIEDTGEDPNAADSSDGTIYEQDAPRTGVYVLEAGRAQWKYVQLLHDNGESYVVKLDKTSTNNLWPGDEIILTAEDLYDGKVVQQ